MEIDQRNAPAGKKPHLRLEEKLDAPSARAVSLIGEWNDWQGQPMEKIYDGNFYACTVSNFEQYTLARFISEGYFERHINKMKNYYREQRHKILAAIYSSPLAAVSQITERNAGTHFVLHINTKLTEAEVRKSALAADMCLSFYSDYSHNTEENNGCTLVINYAAIEADKIAAVIERLSRLFPECNQIS